MHKPREESLESTRGEDNFDSLYGSSQFLRKFLLRFSKVLKVHRLVQNHRSEDFKQRSLLLFEASFEILQTVRFHLSHYCHPPPKELSSSTRHLRTSKQSLRLLLICYTSSNTKIAKCKETGNWFIDRQPYIEMSHRTV